MVEIIWKEPPPLVSSEKAAIIAELKKNPGKWALVQSNYKSSSGVQHWKKLGCESTHRKSEKQSGGKSTEYDIYARWPFPKASERPAGARPAAAAAAAAPAVGPRPAGAGTYDPGLGRAARGIPAEGLHPATLRR